MPTRPNAGSCCILSTDVDVIEKRLNLSLKDADRHIHCEFKLFKLYGNSNSRLGYAYYNTTAFTA